MSITSVVDTLEESECSWVWRGGRIEAVSKSLDGDVSVANNLSILEGLRSSIVGNIRISEGTSLEICYLKVDVEVLVGSNRITSLGVGDDSRDHVGRGRNIPHSWKERVSEGFNIRARVEYTNAVTRSALDLQTVRQGLASAKIDEVCRVTVSMSVDDRKIGFSLLLTSQMQLDHSQPHLPQSH